jgi:hypothetical protein
MKQGNRIEISFSDDTAGNYDTVAEAQDAIEMAATGEAMGPHGDACVPVEIREIDARGQFVRKLFWRCSATLITEHV